MTCRTWMAALLGMTAVAASAPARPEALPDRLMLRLGGYNVSNAEHVIRLDSNNAPAGVFIDFAETLGGETSANVGRLDGLYRFSDKHALGFSWYALRFDGHRTIDKEITWGDLTYNVGTTIDSEIKFDVYKVNYQYSLLHQPDAELGALIGLHVMDTSVGLSATGIANQARSQAVTAPLPVWGLYASYHFTPRLSAYFNYQFFFVSYEDKVKGGLQDFLLGVEYRLFRNFAAGLAMNRFGMDLEAKDDNSTLHYNTDWSGVMLYGSFYF